MAGTGDMARLLANLSQRSPARTAAVTECERRLGAKLPPEYVQFLRTTNGGEGFIGRHAYVIFWGAEELVSMNKAYEVAKYAPGLLVLGSDGGGEAYGFDTRNPQWEILQVPFVGMAWDLAEPVGATFIAFLQYLYNIEQTNEPVRHQELPYVDRGGMEIFEIKPIILGGSPTDPANKMVLNRENHIGAVVYWNKVIEKLRQEHRRTPPHS